MDTLTQKGSDLLRDDLDDTARGIARLGYAIARLQHCLRRVNIRTVDHRMHTIALLDLERAEVRRRFANRIDFVLDLRQHRHFL